MEKYRAGSRSRRAVATACHAKGLGLSADTLLFGEIDSHSDLACQRAFREIASLTEDLKIKSVIGPQFGHLKPESEAFSAFVRHVAFERAGQFKCCLNAKRRGDLLATMLPPDGLPSHLIGPSGVRVSHDDRCIRTINCRRVWGDKPTACKKISDFIELFFPQFALTGAFLQTW